jgi:hypothetical protein
MNSFSAGVEVSPDLCSRQMTSCEMAADSLELTGVLESAREALANASALFREHRASPGKCHVVSVPAGSNKCHSIGFLKLQQVCAYSVVLLTG